VLADRQLLFDRPLGGSILNSATTNHHVSQNAPSSELLQLRSQIASIQQQLVETQRLAAIGELTSTTAHEFNNILMTIMNYARMGLRNTDPAVRERSFDRILKATDRAASITGSILGMARNRGANFEITSLTELVQGVMVLLEKEMQKYRIQVETELDDVPEVPVVGSQIQQVLLNLLINARQAMTTGGRLLIRLKREADQPWVDLIVRDFGSGISREQLPRIFDSGYSTKSGPDETGRGGAGVGLSACRAIVEAHQGKIRVESTLGKGTAFTIRLPLQRVETTTATNVSMPGGNLAVQSESAVA
jgi:signal transduction histidine kinase